MTSTTNLGKYTWGEKPPPLLVTFTDNANVVIDLTGCTVVGEYWVKGQTPAHTPIQFSGSLSDAANGIVSLPWGTTSPSPFAARNNADDGYLLRPYTVELEAWAGDGSVRYASEKFRFVVLASVADATPSI